MGDDARVALERRVVDFASGVLEASIASGASLGVIDGILSALLPAVVEMFRERLAIEGLRVEVVE